MRSLFFLLVVGCLTACNHQATGNEVVIKGYVQNFPDGKLYLTEAHKWKIPLDSTQIQNGHFQFKLKADSLFVPFMAAIHFADSTSNSKMGGFAFRNFTVIPDSFKYAFDAFMLEKGITRIEGVYKSKERLRVFAGKETDVMYRNQFTDFGWLGDLDSAKRQQRISSFKSEIQRYPFSYFLLQEIFNAKEQYSEQELKALLSLFNDEVQSSSLAADIKKYLAIRPRPGIALANLSLRTAHGERHSVIDSNAKLNLLIFWASWCRPCRQEIPALNQLYSQYSGEGINMVSISIDENLEQWQKAVEKEQMKWTQYMIDSGQIETVKQQYNFSAIPLLVFTDDKGFEIQRFLGYEPKNVSVYEKIIQKRLGVLKR